MPSIHSLFVYAVVEMQSRALYATSVVTRILGILRVVRPVFDFLQPCSSLVLHGSSDKFAFSYHCLHIQARYSHGPKKVLKYSPLSFVLQNRKVDLTP